MDGLTKDEIRTALGTCIGDPPDDLVALYESVTPINDGLRIQIRTLPDAIAYTRAIHEIALIGKPLGLFALNDAGDSNPYCYITRGPARGCILHLYHDDDPAVEYGSLTAFLMALTAALATETHIDDLPGKDFRPAVNQRLLCDHFARLVKTDEDAAECELIALSPLLDTSMFECVRSLAQHGSFFVREAAARLIAAYPNARLLDVAEKLAGDKHEQVTRPGRKALSAVRRARMNSLD